MGSYEVHLLPALNDNYIPIICDLSSNSALVIDPACSATVEGFLSRQNLKLTHILNTHHHHDHVGGNLDLKRKHPQVCIIGIDVDAQRIPGIDRRCSEGEVLKFGDLSAQVLFVPGHTLGHCAYYFSELTAVFSGDVLFSCGCGRLFEGTPHQMWQSLLKLRQLPDETLVYCAHEYTLANIEFALSILPEDKNLLEFQRKSALRRHNGQPTIPTTIGVEKALNPFLRADSPEIQEFLGIKDQNAEKTFLQLRKLKDQH